MENQLPVYLEKKYLNEYSDIEKGVDNYIEKKKLKENTGYILEYLPKPKSNISTIFVVFIYNKNYLIYEFENFKDFSLIESTLVNSFSGFYKNEFDEKYIDMIVKKMIIQNITITSMESCTSGMVANLITNTEGASQILTGAQVTYSNSAKVLAGVDSELIDICGVYSAEVASAMAFNCKRTFNTNIGIGVTGTTGNVDPNNSDSVQGEIYYKILADKNAINCKLRLDTNNYSRKEIKEIICGNIFRTLGLIV